MFSPSPETDAEGIAGFSTNDFQYIELQNVGSVDIDLNGYSFASGIEFTFPPYPLSPGAYVIVPGKKDAFVMRYPSVDSALIMKSFKKKLDEFVQTITISDAQGNTILNFTYAEWFPSVTRVGYSYVIKNPQNTDLSSWSRQESWRISILGGSPGASDSGTPFANFDRQSPLFTSSFELTLSIDNGTSTDGTIYYTLDHSIPTIGKSNTKKYTTPIQISTSTEIRTIVKLSSGTVGTVFSRTYLYFDSTMSSWNMMNLPLIIVEGWDNDNFYDHDYIFKNVYAVILEPISDQSVTPITDDRIIWHGRSMMRVHGQTSASEPKKPFTFHVIQEMTNDTHDISVFGLPAFGKWVISSSVYYDRAWIRHALAYNFTRTYFGRYAPRTQFCEMFINLDGSFSTDDYYGSVTFMENIQRGSDRVDVEQMYPEDITEDRISGGWILRIDKPNPNRVQFTAGGQKFYYDYPDYSNMNTQQIDYINNWWDTFLTLLNTPWNTSQLISPWMEYVDVDAAIDYHMMDLIADNVDGLRLSTILHKTRDGPFTWGPVWDFDRTMGCDSQDDSRCASSNWDNYNNIEYYFDNSQAKFWGSFWNDMQFVRRYTNRYIQLRSTIFNLTTFFTILEDLGRQMNVTAARNLVRWNYPPHSSHGSKYWAGILDLEDYYNIRISFLDSQMCYGVKPKCVDNDYCTDDVCSAKDGKCYNILNECPWPSCRYTSSDGNNCDDLNACTINDSCNNGICAGTTRVCTLSIYSCVDTTCNPTIGCVQTPVSARCDDSISCTIDTCSISIGCNSTPSDASCDDSISCTVDLCDTEVDCVHLQLRCPFAVPPTTVDTSIIKNKITANENKETNRINLLTNIQISQDEFNYTISITIINSTMIGQDISIWLSLIISGNTPLSQPQEDSIVTYIENSFSAEYNTLGHVFCKLYKQKKRGISQYLANTMITTNIPAPPVTPITIVPINTPVNTPTNTPTNMPTNTPTNTPPTNTPTNTPTNISPNTPINPTVPPGYDGINGSNPLSSDGINIDSVPFWAWIIIGCGIFLIVIIIALALYVKYKRSEIV